MQWVIKFNPLNNIIKAVNALAKKFKMKGIPNPFEKMDASLDKFKVKTKKYQNQFGSLSDALKGQGKDILKALGIVDGAMEETTDKTDDTTGQIEDAPIEPGGVSGDSEGEEPKGKKKKDKKKKKEKKIEWVVVETGKSLDALYAMENVLNDLYIRFGLLPEVIKEMTKTLGQNLEQGANSFAEYGEQVKNSIKEVILATSASIEGETTAHYISDSLKGKKIKITRLAKGVPVGGSIEYLDDGTLFSAFKNRAPVSED